MPTRLTWDWELEMQYNPRELVEAYELYFFLGPVPPSVSDWRDSPSRLFEPIMSPAHSTTTEFRDLNGYLDERCGDTLEDDGVIPYLRKNLSWGAKKCYLDEKIEISELKSLKVSVYGPDGAVLLSNETPCE